MLAEINAAITSLRAANDIGKAMLLVRDASLVATKAAELQDLLLKAQEALFAHRAEMLALQQEHIKTTEELRKLRETLSERGRYSLVELGDGQFAYRVNVSPEQSGTGQPSAAEPLHYICQRCFDGGRKVVLLKDQASYGGIFLICPACKTELNLGLAKG